MHKVFITNKLHTKPFSFYFNSNIVQDANANVNKKSGHDNR